MKLILFWNARWGAAFFASHVCVDFGECARWLTSAIAIASFLLLQSLKSFFLFFSRLHIFSLNDEIIARYAPHNEIFFACEWVGNVIMLFYARYSLHFIKLKKWICTWRDSHYCFYILIRLSLFVLPLFSCSILRLLLRNFISFCVLLNKEKMNKKGGKREAKRYGDFIFIKVFVNELKCLIWFIFYVVCTITRWNLHVKK